MSNFLWTKGAEAWVYVPPINRPGYEPAQARVTIVSVAKYVTVERPGWRFGKDGRAYFDPVSGNEVSPARRAVWLRGLVLRPTEAEVLAIDGPRRLYANLARSMAHRIPPPGVTEERISRAAALLGFSVDLTGRVYPTER